MRALAGVFVALCFAACRCVEPPDGRYQCDPVTGEDCDDGGTPSDGGIDGGFDGGPPGEEDAGVGLCSGHWCWEHPRPLGRIVMRGIFELSPSDVWSVGAVGNVQHWDGQRWEQVPSGTTAPLFRVWGQRSDSVWMVGGSGTVLEWNGTELVRHDAGVGVELRAIAGIGPRELYVIGIQGTVAKYDGVQWSRPVVPPPSSVGNLYAAVGWPDGGVYAWGDNGLRFNAGTWSVAPKPPDAGIILSAWAPSVDDAWLVGTSGGLYRNTTSDLADAGWETFDAGTSLNLSAVFAFGAHGYWGSANGGFWETTNVVPLSLQPIHSIHGLSPTDVWACGQGSFLHRRVDNMLFDDTWPPEDFNMLLQGVALLPGGAAWAVGDQHAAFVRDGGTWTRVRNEGNVNFGWYYDVWAAPNAPAIAVGGAPIQLAYWDAGAQVMSRVELGMSEELWGVWGSSASDIWAVGQNRTIVHFDGGTWTVLPRDTRCAGDEYEEVHGSGPSDVWIVGNHGCVTHWNGATFTDESVGADEIVNGVAAVSASEVYVASLGGRIWRRAGASGWTSETVPALSRFHDLTVYQGTVWAAGDNALILKREPSSGAWIRTVVPVEPGGSTMQTITASPREGMLAAGAVGIILFRK